MLLQEDNPSTPCDGRDEIKDQAGIKKKGLHEAMFQV
jgi:hypothetical protein